MVSFKHGVYIMIALLSLLFPFSAWSDPVKLNETLFSGGSVNEYSISPDSRRVVYTAYQDADDVQELYSVPIGGGTPVKLSAPLVSGGDVSSWIISADSTRVVYKADQDTYDVDELYSVRLTFSPLEPFPWELFIPAIIKKKK